MLIHIPPYTLIQNPQLQGLPWLVHGFGTKDVRVEQYLQTLGVVADYIPQTRQTHGNTVHELRTLPVGESPLLEGDALVTDQPGMVCWVRTADCLPMLLVDPEKKVVAAVHAGWRGTALEIVRKTLSVMESRYGCKVTSIFASLGPAIGGRKYRVGKDVVEAFEKIQLHEGPWMEEVDPGHWHLDIAYANAHLLEQTGILRDKIYLSLACTASDLKRFHSFRKEGERKGDQVSFVMIKP